MVLYIPYAGTEPVIVEQYLVKGWYESCGYSGCNCPEFTMSAPPGWHPDPSWNECATKQYFGGHGGCSDCIMILSQAIADYHTEVTFMSNPHGAQIFIDGVEWWPGAVTAVDGATFRGISPGTHTYELRMAGYQNATGTFELALNTPVIITGNLVPPCIPNWQCELPMNGYENDGCGNRRVNTICNPSYSGIGIETVIVLGLIGAGILGVIIYTSNSRK